MHEDASRKREHLRLILQAAERSRIDKPVAITFEFRAVVVAQRMPLLLSEPFIADELLPVHNLLPFWQSYAYFVAFRLFKR